MNDRSVVEDIRRAFEKYSDADAGLIVSTAVRARVEIEKKLRDSRKKRIRM